MKHDMIGKVLADPSVSYWLKNALRSAVERDPVDVANDLEVMRCCFDEQEGPGPFVWGDESHETRAQVEDSIARHLCGVLCDGDAGMVDGAGGGEIYRLHVQVRLVDREVTP